MTKTTKRPASLTTNAAIYLRVSTEEQAESGLGLEAQESRCRALVASRGWTLSGVYREEGVSGTTEPSSRPAFAALLAEVEAGRVGAVVVLKIDRLARRAEWIHRVLREFEEVGAGVVSVSEPVDTSSAMGRAFIGISAVFAELERNVIAERTRQALAVKRERGERIGGAYLGIRVERGEEVEVPEERETAARIGELRAEGLTLRAIAAQLTAEGRRTKRGGRWAAETVAKVVRRAERREALAAAA